MQYLSNNINILIPKKTIHNIKNGFLVSGYK